MIPSAEGVIKKGRYLNARERQVSCNLPQRCPRRGREALENPDGNAWKSAACMLECVLSLWRMRTSCQEQSVPNAARLAASYRLPLQILKEFLAFLAILLDIRQKPTGVHVFPETAIQAKAPMGAAASIMADTLHSRWILLKKPSTSLPPRLWHRAYQVFASNLENLSLIHTVVLHHVL
jgi:hypothetical protein